MGNLTIGWIICVLLLDDKPGDIAFLCIFAKGVKLA